MSASSSKKMPLPYPLGRSRHRPSAMATLTDLIGDLRAAPRTAAPCRSTASKQLRAARTLPLTELAQHSAWARVRVTRTRIIKGGSERSLTCAGGPSATVKSGASSWSSRVEADTWKFPWSSQVRAHRLVRRGAAGRSDDLDADGIEAIEISCAGASPKRKIALTGQKSGECRPNCREPSADVPERGKPRSSGCCFAVPTQALWQSLAVRIATHCGRVASAGRKQANPDAGPPDDDGHRHSRSCPARIPRRGSGRLRGRRRKYHHPGGVHHPADPYRTNGDRASRGHAAWRLQ